MIIADIIVFLNMNLIMLVVTCEKEYVCVCVCVCVCVLEGRECMSDWLITVKILYMVLVEI